MMFTLHWYNLERHQYHQTFIEIIENRNKLGQHFRFDSQEANISIFLP